jgi:ABC-type nitrate/sulfonate/bicarbonate transport system substrate-binding protein
MTKSFALRARALAGLCIVGGLGASTSLRAQAPPPISMDPATLKVGFFGKNIAMIAAQDQGFFAAMNLTVQYLQIASSEQAFTDLKNGAYDIILTSVDNVVNYRLNPHNALGATLPVQAFMGIDYSNNLTAAGRLGIEAIEDLRGKVVAVDAPASGFAYVLYEILGNHGLRLGTDYSVKSIGGGASRYSALIARTVDGTLLNNGFELRAAAGGLRLFETVFDIANPYLGSVGVALEPWMQSHGDVLVRFIRAYVAGSAWSFDPANHDAAVAKLMNPTTPRELAEGMLAAQLTPGKGLIPDAYIGETERIGLANVLFLRQKYDGFEQPQDLRCLASPSGGIYDLQWYRRAVPRDP